VLAVFDLVDFILIFLVFVLTILLIIVGFEEVASSN